MTQSLQRLEVAVRQSETIPQIICAMHGSSTCLRHLAKAMKGRSSVFEFITFVCKNFGTRSTKNEREYFQHFVRQSFPDYKPPRGLTGVRFHELVQDADLIYGIQQYVPTFLNVTRYASLLQQEYNEMISKAHYNFMQNDLCAVIGSMSML